MINTKIEVATLIQRAVFARSLPINITNIPAKIGSQISRLNNELSIVIAQVMGAHLQTAPKLK